MQKSKIDVTKILIVPFFGSKNHNISAIVFQKAQQKGTIGVAGHHFMIFPPQHFVFTWWRKAALIDFVWKGGGAAAHPNQYQNQNQSQVLTTLQVLTT